MIKVEDLQSLQDNYLGKYGHLGRLIESMEEDIACLKQKGDWDEVLIAMQVKEEVELEQDIYSEVIDEIGELFLKSQN